MSGAYFDSGEVERRPAASSGDPAPLRFAPPTSRAGWRILLVAVAALVLLALAVGQRLATGVGVWSLGRPVGWAAEVAGLGFWLGLALASSAIAAIWKRRAEDAERAVPRFAATASFASAACALVVGLLHLGRTGLAYWLLPLPLRSELWPQWASPIAWSSLAVAVWAILALAAGRLGGRSPAARLDAVVAGSALVALALVAASGIVSPVGAGHALLLVLAGAAGAFVAGLAVTLALAALAGAELGRLPAALSTAALVYGGLRLVELAVAWGAGVPGGGSRVEGPFAGAFWLAVAATAGAPQLVRLTGVRDSRSALVVVALAGAAGFALDRLVEPVATLTRDLLPATWSGWAPGGADFALAIGCVGLFVALCVVTSSPRRGIDRFEADDRRRSTTSGSPTPLSPEVT